ncbi:MAG: LacI family transcriptional regulator [Hyphomicrobiales bacterium]|nr:MAG: LacI family transcriptional regulator [Hyphomicrobiales bacterium]
MTEQATRARGRATADMVAKTANVSRVAVSRAFNPHASIKPEKRDHILRVAQELNYTPDMAARSMVTGRSHLVAVIVPDVSSPWESQEIDALTNVLQAEGFATLLFKTRRDLSLDETLLTYMKGFNPDSVIAYAENVRPHVLSRVLERAVPIYIDYPNGEEVDETEPAPLFDRLEVMQRDGIDQAIALMQGYGAKRIAFIGGVPSSLAARARERMVQQLMAAREMAPPILIPGDYSYDTAYRSTIDLFRLGDGADAVFAANDVGAFGAMDALRHELGLAVPKDVMVVGFDDINQSHWKSYDLTTVKFDLDERARALMRLILRRLKAPTAPSLTETISTKLVVRGTVG